MGFKIPPIFCISQLPHNFEESKLIYFGGLNLTVFDFGGNWNYNIFWRIVSWTSSPSLFLFWPIRVFWGQTPKKKHKWPPTILIPENPLTMATNEIPDGAACYICLEEKADEEGKPPVRDCSCRGDSADRTFIMKKGPPPALNPNNCAAALDSIARVVLSRISVR